VGLVSDFDRLEEQTDNAIKRSNRTGASGKKSKKGKKGNKGKRAQKQNTNTQSKTTYAEKESKSKTSVKFETESSAGNKAEGITARVAPKMEHAQQDLQTAKIVDLTGAFSNLHLSGTTLSPPEQRAASARAFERLKPSPALSEKSFSELVEREWIGSTYGTGQNSLDKHFHKHVKKSVKKEYYFSMSRLFSFIEAANSNNEIRRFRDGNYAFVLKGTVFEAFGGHFSKSDGDERHTYTFYKHGSEKINNADVAQFRSVLQSYMQRQSDIAETIMTSSLRRHYDMLFQD
jgi:hypothetical protein